MHGCFMKTVNNEKGFVLITSLLILVVVMIIGIAATNTTSLELQISSNDRLTKVAFYSAESGIAYTFSEDLEHLYGMDNRVVGDGYSFPSDLSPNDLESNPPAAPPAAPIAPQIMGANGIQNFQGTIIYREERFSPGFFMDDSLNIGSTIPLMDHFYEVRSTGFGPVNARAIVEVGVQKKDPANSF